MQACPELYDKAFPAGVSGEKKRVGTGQQWQGLLRTVGNQNAVRAGADPVPSVAFGDRGAQHRVAHGVVADITTDPGQRGHDARVGRPPPVPMAAC